MGSDESSSTKVPSVEGAPAPRAPGTATKLRPWQVESSERVLEERYLEVWRERVRTGSGFVIPDYHLIRSPSWAAALCVTSDRNLVLVRQYRHGHQGFSLELPAGVVDAGEDPLDTARRELREETGYESETLGVFWSARPEPARHRQMAHFAFGRGAELLRPQALDASEDIHVELHPIAELDRVLAEMVHGLHVAALLRAERMGLFND